MVPEFFLKFVVIIIVEEIERSIRKSPNILSLHGTRKLETFLTSYNQQGFMK